MKSRFGQGRETTSCAFAARSGVPGTFELPETVADAVDVDGVASLPPPQPEISAALPH